MPLTEHWRTRRTHATAGVQLRAGVTGDNDFCLPGSVAIPIALAGPPAQCSGAHTINLSGAMHRRGMLACQRLRARAVEAARQGARGVMSEMSVACVSMMLSAMGLALCCVASSAACPCSAAESHRSSRRPLQTLAQSVGCVWQAECNSSCHHIPVRRVVIQGVCGCARIWGSCTGGLMTR